MASPGDLKTRFGRSYIFLNPETSIPSPEQARVGTWRLEIDEVDPGPGPDPTPPGALGFKARVKEPGGIQMDQLVYIDNDGAYLAKADTYATSQVAGIAFETKGFDEEIIITRNETVDFFGVTSFVDGAPAFLTPGSLYYLSSTTAGNWTTTPDTTTAGVVVAQVGTAVGPNLMSVEVQPPIVI